MAARLEGAARAAEQGLARASRHDPASLRRGLRQRDVPAQQLPPPLGRPARPGAARITPRSSAVPGGARRAEARPFGREVVRPRPSETAAAALATAPPAR